MNQLEALGVVAKLARALSSDRILILARNLDQARAQATAVFEVLESLNAAARYSRSLREDRITMRNGAAAIFRSLECESGRGISAQIVIADEVAWNDVPWEARITFAPVLTLAKEVIWR